MISPGSLIRLGALVWRALRIGPPRPIGTAERLGNIPLAGAPVRADVRIRWNQWQVPSIEAASDEDLAVGLGVVHAHLRLAQMEALRRFATGRVSEIAGPATIGFDRALRLMGFTRAVPAIAAMLPPATRAWADGFLAGVNHVIAAAPALPHEFALFDCVPAPWTLDDLLAVMRLAATDVSWVVFRRLLAAEEKLGAADWQALWPRLQAADTLAVADDDAEAALGVVRGSNCAAVAGRRSGQRTGIIASDPHLSIAVPPLWLVAGLHAPGLDAVGLMIPALPAVAIGRNRWIAWGGTNLHAASSELVDVTDEPIVERREAIGVRGRGEVAVTLRETRFGPVVSDGLLLPSRRKLALRWVGHRPSDELTAMLGVMGARDLAGFRAALAGFALPGMTMVAAEAGEGGRAGRAIAAHLPRRPPAPPPALVCPPDRAWRLDDLVAAAAFAAPEEDVVVSANDRPRPTPVPVGFFFSRPDRARRMRTLLECAGPVTVATMRALQQDVHQESALMLRDALLARAPEGPAKQALAAWDGGYDAACAGALAFEAVLAALARAMIPRHALDLLSGLWSGRALVAHRVRAAPAEALAAAFGEATRVLRRLGTWGEAHRLALRHPLAALPLVGRRYAAPEMAAAGGNDTLNKTGHGPVRGRHRVTYGACARHISDLALPDANLFVLLGGQDGWLGSANATDQVALWRAGEYITVPLGAETAHAWPHRTDLRPNLRP